MYSKSTKNLAQMDGTIAKILTENMDKITLCGNNINMMKQTVLDILQNSEDIKSDSARQEAIRFLTKAPNVSSFLSTLTTYITGVKV